MTRRLVCGAALAVALGACFGGGAAAPAPAESPVSDQDALQFAQRVERFYGALSEVPLDAWVTYDNKDLRGYFPSPGAYADYYSALATEAREATLRDGEARSVKIQEFRFESADQAVVEFVLRGDHERQLLFWDVKIDRRDVWRRVEGVWLLFPEKL
jgi:hypothetical protein